MTTVLQNQGAASTQLGNHEKELMQLKIQANTIEQSAKSSTIRLIGFPVLEDEIAAAPGGGSALRNKIFERIIKPVFTSAVTAGSLTSADCNIKIDRAGKAAVGSFAAADRHRFLLPAAQTDCPLYEVYKCCLPQPC